MRIALYTDGGCHNHGVHKGIGAWAYVVVDVDTNREIASGSELCEGTTNNRMEYLAFIKGMLYCLNNLAGATHIQAYSDSQLLINTFNTWIYTWIKNGTLRNKANPDLLDELSKIRYQVNARKKDGYFDFTLQWVKGHAGNQWNEHCDKLCTELIKQKISPAPTTTTIIRKKSDINTSFDSAFTLLINRDTLNHPELNKLKKVLILQRSFLEHTYNSI